MRAYGVIGSAWRTHAQALHRIRRADAEQGESVAQHLSHGDDQREPRVPQPNVVDQEALRIILTVEFLRQILEMERELVRRELARGERDLVGEIAETTQ